VPHGRPCGALLTPASAPAAGNQAIKSLHEEGCFVILINPNIATVQTAPAGSADKLYLLPVDAENVEKVIRQLGVPRWW
jgi:carbamoylphosphate synthase large subunit